MAEFTFDDASLVLHADTTVFHVHRGLLSRQSPKLAKLIESTNDGVLRLDVTPEDLSALLKHLYHDLPIITSGFQHVAAVLRITSPEQLDLPRVYSLAKGIFQDQFGPMAAYKFESALLEQALELAIDHNIIPAQKSLFYNLVTTTDFDLEDAEPTTTNTISPSNLKICRSLLNEIIAYFTPILFTPPATAHMECTDVFADKWMPLVIQPALKNDGVYKPIETLNTIRDINWAIEGLCASCFEDKKVEWQEEQAQIWQKLDVWIALK